MNPDQPKPTAGEQISDKWFGKGQPSNIILGREINAALAAAVMAQMDNDDAMWSAKLDAEREKFARWNEMEGKQLNEKVHTLVDALQRLVDGDFDYDVRNIADEALAKVGEGQHE